MPKKDRIIALDIGSSGIKLAEFAATPGAEGAIELVNFAVGAVGLPPGNEEERPRYITMTIRELMAERGIRPGPVLLSVSGQQVFSRFVRLPPVDKDKVYQIVAYEAQQNVPFPIDEVVWDYQLIGTTEGELDVMLAAIKGEIIESLTAAVEDAGLITDLVDVAPMALYNAARYSGADVEGCALLLDIGARSTDLIFLEEGRVFIRSIPVAGNTITQSIARELEISYEDAEDLKCEHAFVGLGGAYEAHEDETKDRVSKIVRNVMTRMHAEINRSINFYRGQQGGSKPVKLYLTGGTASIPGTDTFFREKLKTPVEFFNPFANVAVNEDIDTDAITANVNVMGQTVGLALRRFLSCPIEINLMPATVQASKELRKRRPVFVMAGIAVVLTLLVWCAYFLKMSQLGQDKLEKLSGDVRTLESQERLVKAAQRQVATVQSQIDSLQDLFPERERWPRILNEIRRLLPSGMYLQAVTPCDPSRQGRTRSSAMSMEFGGPGMMMGRGALRGMPSAQEPAEEDKATCLVISGVGYIDRIGDREPIVQFRDILRSSALFSDNTEVLTTRQTEEFLREFQIEVVLAESEKDKAKKAEKAEKAGAAAKAAKAKKEVAAR